MDGWKARGEFVARKEIAVPLEKGCQKEKEDSTKKKKGGLSLKLPRKRGIYSMERETQHNG